MCQMIDDVTTTIITIAARAIVLHCFKTLKMLKGFASLVCTREVAAAENAVSGSNICRLIAGAVAKLVCTVASEIAGSTSSDWRLCLSSWSSATSSFILYLTAKFQIGHRTREPSFDLNG